MSSTRGSCVNARNPHAVTPLQRALFVALDEWVDGKAPPPSRTPRLANGTLTAPEKLAFPDDPGYSGGAARERDRGHQGLDEARNRHDEALSNPRAAGRRGRERHGRRADARHRGADRNLHGLEPISRAVSRKARHATATARTRRSPERAPSARRAAILGRRSRSATARTPNTSGATRQRCNSS